MSQTVAQLVAEVKVTGDIEAKQKLGEVNKKTEETKGLFDKLKQGFEMGLGMKLSDIPFQAFNLIKDQMVDTVKVAMQHQQIEEQTVQVLKSTRDVSGMTADALDNLATAFSKTTEFSADTVQGGENLLLTFTNIGKGVFPQATQAILDVSQAMGQDLKSSAIQVGKALGDPLTGMSALQRIGVTFSAQEKEQIKTMMAHNDIMGAQKIILKELSTEFGGSATAAGKTFGGQLDILKNRFEDLKIKVGTAVMPLLADLMKWVENVALPDLQLFGNWFVNYGVPALQSLGDMLGTYVMPVLGTFAGWIGDIFSFLTSGNPLVWVLAGALGAVGLAIAGIKIADFAVGLKNAVDKAKDGKGVFGELADKIKNDVGKAFDDLTNKQVPNLKKAFSGSGKDSLAGAAEDVTNAEKNIGTTMKTTVEQDVAEGSLAAEGSIKGISQVGAGVEGEVATESAGMKLSLMGVLGALGMILPLAQQVEQAMGGIKGPDNQTLDQHAKMTRGAGVIMGPGMNFFGHAGGLLNNPVGHWAMVGERGPEPMWVPQGASILPNGTAPSAFSAGNGGANTNQPIILQVDGRTFARLMMPHLTSSIRHDVGVSGL